MRFVFHPVFVFLSLGAMPHYFRSVSVVSQGTKAIHWPQPVCALAQALRLPCRKFGTHSDGSEVRFGITTIPGIKQRSGKITVITRALSSLRSWSHAKEVAARAPSELRRKKTKGPSWAGLGARVLRLCAGCVRPKPRPKGETRCLQTSERDVETTKQEGFSTMFLYKRVP